MSSSPSDFLWVLIVLAAIIGVVALFVTITKKQARKIQDNYQMLADKLGLSVITTSAVWYKANVPKLSGNYKGRQIDVETELKGSGEDQDHHTEIVLQTKNKSYSLQLTKEYWISNVGKALFKSQDIQINDPFFDKKYIIKSDNEMFAKRFFNQEMKRLLTDFHPKFNGEIVVEPFKIHFTQIYQIDSSKTYDLTLEAIEMLTKIANRVEDLQ